MKIFAAAILSLFLSGMLPARAADAETRPGIAWRAWSPDLFRQAGRRQRLVLLDLSAGWCAYCRKMDATTWWDPQVQMLVAEHYLPARVVDEEQPALAERYRDHGRPALVIYDAQGRELLRKRGYLKPQWMRWLLEAVVQEQKETAR